MSALSSPELDELIARVRAEARRPEYQLSTHSAPSPFAVLPMPAAAVQPAAAPSSPADAAHARSAERAVREVDDLLLIVNSRTFIEQAYLSLLGRPADAEGLRHYGEKLAQGMGQPFVLGALEASAEARAHASRLPGLGLIPLVFKAWQLSEGVHLGSAGRLLCRAYHGWRHLKLAISGRLATHFNSRLQEIEAVTTLPAQLQALEARLGEQHAQLLAHNAQQALATSTQQAEQQARLAAQEAALSEQAETLDEVRQAQSDALRAALAQTEARFVQQQLDLDVLHSSLRLFHLDKRHRTPAGAVAPAPSSAPAAVTETETTALETRIAHYYLAFEDAHRGSAEDIRRSQRHYLAALAELPTALLALPVLDLGCGRGEWLELLGEQGLRARGVDLNPLMVAHCRSRGVDAEQADALAVLTASADASLAAISAFHLIEHLPFETLFRIVEEAARVLAPGGLLIFETPNPENVLVGSHTFYHDYSHRNPLTPTAVDFLLAYHGFSPRRLLRLHPYPATARVEDGSAAAERLNGHFYGPQDFAIIGSLPAPAPAADPDLLPAADSAP